MSTILDYDFENIIAYSGSEKEGLFQKSILVHPVQSLWTPQIMTVEPTTLAQTAAFWRRDGRRTVGIGRGQRQKEDKRSTSCLEDMHGVASKILAACSPG